MTRPWAVCPFGLQQRTGWLLDRWPGRILQAAAGLGRIEVFDRSMTIAAQFFSSVLPVLILIATLGSNSNSFADAIDVPEQSRQVLEGAVDGGGAAFGIVGAIFVLVSATSLSRALTRSFTAIWGLPRPRPAPGSGCSAVRSVDDLRSAQRPRPGSPVRWRRAPTGTAPSGSRSPT